MIVYRYEKSDGGGPWCTRDGHPRNREEDSIFEKKGKLFGCITLESLFKYFKSRPLLIKDCKIKMYDIPEEDLEYSKDKTVVCFPDTYKSVN